MLCVQQQQQRKKTGGHISRNVVVLKLFHILLLHPVYSRPHSYEVGPKILDLIREWTFHCHEGQEKKGFLSTMKSGSFLEIVQRKNIGYKWQTAHTYPLTFIYHKYFQKFLPFCCNVVVTCLSVLSLYKKKYHIF